MHHSKQSNEQSNNTGHKDETAKWQLVRKMGLFRACFVIHNLCLLRDDVGDWLDQEPGAPRRQQPTAAADAPDAAGQASPARAVGADRTAARQAGHRRRLATIRHLRPDS